MKNKVLKNLKNTIIILLVILSAFIITGSLYYKRTYPKQDFDLIVFTIKTGLTTASPSVTINIILSCLGQFVAFLLLFYILLAKNTKHSVHLIVNKLLKNKEKDLQLFPIKLTSNHRFFSLLILIIVSITIFTKSFGVDEYIKNNLQNSTIFEDYYVDGRDISIKFPDTKRNLIIVVGESFENTVFSKENGGAWDYSLMPELENLALENISFSNNNKLGGSIPTYGSCYSAAGNVAITAGIPLKVTEFTENANLYEGSDNYLAGSYTLGEVLQDNGYTNEIMMGSDGYFGCRKQYYQCNGNYKVFDVNYAIEQGKMTESDKVWWGFEDDKLYDWSKEEITELASQEKPFNYILLTADTHFEDGYLSEKAPIKYPDQYENVHAYASELAYDFVNWIKEQSFYENTTIVIVGDHLGMQKEFYESKIDDKYERTVYNVIINSVTTPKRTQNRAYTPMDMYPTMLASIGVEIEGNRLGLGTNLFSDVPTICEELGYENFNKELAKKSTFYNHRIVGDEYYSMKKEFDEENKKKKEEQTTN